MAEIREFACWDSPEDAPLVRKWVPLEDYERLRAAARDLLRYLDEHDWGLVPEGATADRLRDLVIPIGTTVRSA
jgi:hypothetical protein